MYTSRYSLRHAMIAATLISFPSFLEIPGAEAQAPSRISPPVVRTPTTANSTARLCSIEIRIGGRTLAKGIVVLDARAKPRKGEAVAICTEAQARKAKFGDVWVPVAALAEAVGDTKAFRVDKGRLIAERSSAKGTLDRPGGRAPIAKNAGGNREVTASQVGKLRLGVQKTGVLSSNVRAMAMDDEEEVQMIPATDLMRAVGHNGIEPGDNFVSAAKEFQQGKADLPSAAGGMLGIDPHP